MERHELITWETIEGAAVEVQGRSLTPVAQALRLSTPLGGFVWNRPVAILVTSEGKVTRIPIVDFTRIALWAVAGASVLSVIIAALAQRLTRKEA